MAALMSATSAYLAQGTQPAQEAAMTLPLLEEVLFRPLRLRRRPPMAAALLVDLQELYPWNNGRDSPRPEAQLTLLILLHLCCPVEAATPLVWAVGMPLV